MSVGESTRNRCLSIDVRDLEGGALVSLRGRLSIESAPGLRDRFLAILNRGSLPVLTVDLAEVTYLDVAGIATLVELFKLAHHRKTKLRFRGLRDRPRYLLEVTGLLHLFETHGSFVSEAS
jgi:anti-sigma B factor antagonist